MSAEQQNIEFMFNDNQGSIVYQEGKFKIVHKDIMPSKIFWDSLEKYIYDLKKENAKIKYDANFIADCQMKEIKKCKDQCQAYHDMLKESQDMCESLLKERKQQQDKIVYVNKSKKSMFAAGIGFAKGGYSAKCKTDNPILPKGGSGTAPMKGN